MVGNCILILSKIILKGFKMGNRCFHAQESTEMKSREEKITFIIRMFLSQELRVRLNTGLWFPSRWFASVLGSLAFSSGRNFLQHVLLFQDLPLFTYGQPLAALFLPVHRITEHGSDTGKLSLQWIHFSWFSYLGALRFRV